MGTKQYTSLSFLYLHLVVVVEGLLHLAVIAAESIKLVAGHGCWLLGNVRNYCWCDGTSRCDADECKYVALLHFLDSLAANSRFW